MIKTAYMEITTTILLATNLVNLGFIFLLFSRSRPGAPERLIGITMLVDGSFGKIGDKTQEILSKVYASRD